MAGLFFFGLLPLLARLEDGYYSRKEPYFGYPVSAAADGSVRLRNDDYGDGYFGASRNGGRRHEGIDFLAASGDPIYASKSGRVTHSAFEKGYGQYIELFHPDGLYTRYAHLSQLLLREGDWVKNGQVIGLAGKSGNARNAKILPHLHFEIRDNKQALDPTKGLLDPAIQLSL